MGLPVANPKFALKGILLGVVWVGVVYVEQQYGIEPLSNLVGGSIPVDALVSATLGYWSGVLVEKAVG